MKKVSEISDDVGRRFPYLSLCYKLINNPKNARLKMPNLEAFKLTKSELSEYICFRKKIAGKKLLAVERLLKVKSNRELPNPDPITRLIIEASYKTGLPITVFTLDRIGGAIVIRFSKSGEFLQLSEKQQRLPEHSLVAVAGDKIIGQFGIKSSLYAKLGPINKSVIILSFAISTDTSQKCRNVIEKLSASLI